MNGTKVLTVRRWDDIVIDELGHRPDGGYAERFWLPLLGPTSLWLLRRLAQHLQGWSDDTLLVVDADDLAQCLGVTNHNNRRRSTLWSAVDRLVRYELAMFDDDGILAVRVTVPELTPARACRLPDSLRGQHDRLQNARLAQRQEVA